MSRPNSGNPFQPPNPPPLGENMSGQGKPLTEQPSIRSQPSLASKNSNPFQPPQPASELPSASGAPGLHQRPPSASSSSVPQSSGTGSSGTGSYSAGGDQDGQPAAVFNPLQALQKEEQNRKEEEEDNDLEDSDFLDVDSSEDSHHNLGQQPTSNFNSGVQAGSPRSGNPNSSNLNNGARNNNNNNITMQNGIPTNQVAYDFTAVASHTSNPDTVEDLNAQRVPSSNGFSTEVEEELAKKKREPAFSEYEEVKDRRISKSLGKVYSVLYEWKLLFLIILIACMAISIVGLIVSVVELVKDVKLKAAREVGMYSAVAMIDSISSCGRAFVSSPGKAISEPKIVEKLKKSIAKSAVKKSEMDKLIEDAKNALAKQDCEAAADAYNELFSMGYERSAELLSADGPAQISMFARGWALSWTQLRAEGVLAFSEDPPVSSARGIRGVGYNVMCLKPLARESLADKIAAEYQCSDEYNAILSGAPVDPVNYQMRLHTMLDLVQSLGVQNGVPNPIPEEIFHIVSYSVVLLMCILAVLYLIQAPFENSRINKEQEIVLRDFHVSSHVEMRRSTLRLLDYYTWRMGAFESVNTREARRIGFELTEEQMREEEEARRRRLIGGTGDLNPQQEGSDRASMNSNDPLAESRPGTSGSERPDRISAAAEPSQASRDSFADQLAKNVNDDLHMYKGKTLLQQSVERAQRIARYVDGATSLEDAAQIQLLIHKVAYSLLLLRPFIPRHALKPCDLDPRSIKNLGPSLHLRQTQLILQEGLETDVSTYLFVSFYPFNRPEAVASSRAFHMAKIDLEKQRFIEGEAQRQAEKCCLFQDHNLEKLYEDKRKKESPDLMTAAADKEAEKREAERVVVKGDSDEEDDENNLLNGETDHRSNMHRSILANANLGANQSEEIDVVGGRLTNAENIVNCVLEKKNAVWLAQQKKGGPGPAAPNRLSYVPSVGEDGQPDSGVLRAVNAGEDDTSHLIPQHYNGHPPSEDGSAHSSNPLLGADHVGAAQGLAPKFVSQYPLSNLAAGVNYVVESIFRCSSVYHGDVVQVCGDGVLVKFSTSRKDQDNRLGAKHTREDSTSMANSTSEDTSEDDMDDNDGLLEIVVNGQTHQLSAAERAVRTAIGLQEAMRNYLDYSEDMYISPELLQCPMAIVSEDYSLKGRLRYHVTKHYAVLSRCIPLIFALERINIEYGAEIVMTEPVKAQVESFVLSRPIHFLQVADLNYHYIKATKTNSRNDTHKSHNNNNNNNNNSSTSSASPMHDDDDAGSPSSPEKRRRNLEDNGDASPSSASPKRSRSRNPEERSRFVAQGTIYELFNVLPLSTSDMHFKTYMNDESHNRVRREHWRLIWEKYITIVGFEPQINLLRKFVNTNENAGGDSPTRGGGNGHGNGGHSPSMQASLTSNPNAPGTLKRGDQQDPSFEGSIDNAFHQQGNGQNPGSMENSFANNSTSRMENRGQSIASSITSMRDRLHDFMRELHTYNHIYEFSSREQYSCEKLWKYGHDLLITLGVTEEELDNEYG